MNNDKSEYASVILINSLLRTFTWAIFVYKSADKYILSFKQIHKNKFHIITM
jgi:hypothetical protein